MAHPLRIDRSDDPALAHAIRRAVFVEEQGIAEALEFDGTDPGFTHWVGWSDGHPVATLRGRLEGATLRIGRVATLPDARGQGHGRALMTAVMDWGRQGGARHAELSAQDHVVTWYRTLGFAVAGPPYLEAGILHRDMVAPL